MRCLVPLVLGLALSATSAAAPAHKPHPRAHHAAAHHHHFVGAASTTDTMTLSSPSGSGSQLASSPAVAASLAMASPSAPRASANVRLEVAPAHDDAADDGPAPPPAVVTAPRAALTVTPVDHSPGRERRWGLVGGGLALFLGGYALDIGISYGVGHSGAAESLIPIVGPLVQLNQSWAMVAPANTGNADVDAQANSRIASANHAIQVAAYAVLSVDCALQLAGAAMAIVGAVGHAPRRFAAVTKGGVAWNFAPNGVRLRF
jgi:hypothetical protein